METQLPVVSGRTSQTHLHDGFGPVCNLNELTAVLFLCKVQSINFCWQRLLPRKCFKCDILSCLPAIVPDL